jgi:hypothetical protein
MSETDLLPICLTGDRITDLTGDWAMMGFKSRLAMMGLIFARDVGLNGERIAGFDSIGTSSVGFFAERVSREDRGRSGERFSGRTGDCWRDLASEVLTGLRNSGPFAGDSGSGSLDGDGGEGIGVS